MSRGIGIAQRTDQHLPVLTIHRRDPLASAVNAVFGRRVWLLCGLIAVVGAVCVFVIPATNGTLLPRPGFDSALSDIYSIAIWVLIIPIAAVAYVRQLTHIPRLFQRLYENHVTGLNEDGYQRFIADSARIFNRWYWFPFSMVALLPFWVAFLRSVAASPYTWYHPANTWPWVVYYCIEYLEIIAAVSYALRYIITCQRLGVLLRAEHIQPQLLHPDGLSGFASIVEFVTHSLVIAGGVLIVFALETLNTARTVPNFSESAALLLFIVVAGIYVVLVPYLLLYPLRLALRGIRYAKHQLLSTVTARINEGIWSQLRHVAQLQEAQGASAAVQAVDALIENLKPLGESVAALETLPETLFDIGARSRQAIVLSAVVPPLAAIAIHVSAVLWDWDAVIRQVGATLPH